MKIKNLSKPNLKKKILIILLLLIYSLIFSINIENRDEHFVPIFQGNPINPMSIYVTAASLDGINLNTDDEIGVFDGENCVASILLTGEIIEHVVITVSADDPNTGELEGFTSGNPIIFKLWSSSSSTEITDVAVTYQLGNNIFIFNETIAVALSGTSSGQNHAPVSNAGIDQTVQINELVTLDGSASYDEDDDTLTYLWTAPEGIVLNNNTIVNPTFTAPSVTENTEYEFVLVVSDQQLNSAPDAVIITVIAPNQVPIANAGEDQEVNEGINVNLNGSNSFDPEGENLSYLWSSPQGIILNNSSSATPSFLSPEVDEDTEFIFSLVVNDGELNSIADEIIVNVLNIVNQLPPVADAGDDQSVNEGDIVTLDASASYDPNNDNLSFLWITPVGISLNDNTAISPHFTAPFVSESEIYSIELEVSDGNFVDSDTLTITVNSIDHFIPVYLSVRTPMNFYITLAEIDGNPLLEGDEIGIFDGELCVGAGILEGEISTFFSMIASADDPTTPQTDGFISGNNIIFKLWNSINNTEVTDISVTFQSGSQTFLPGGTTNVALAGTTAGGNHPPIAEAGENQTVEEGLFVQLDGSNSYDPDNDNLTYLWTAPEEITLSNSVSVNPSFTAPQVSENTEFQIILVVNDGELDSSQDAITVIVQNIPPQILEITDITCSIQNSEITITWNTENDFDYFKIYRHLNNPNFLPTEENFLTTTSNLFYSELTENKSKAFYKIIGIIIE